MLKFNKKTKWGDFLDAYLDATQRKPVAEEGGVTVDLAEVSLPSRKAGESAALPDEVRPVRRVPPWLRGGDSTSARIKNHPATDVGICNTKSLRKHR